MMAPEFALTPRGEINSAMHPRQLIQALDFIMANRVRFPFKEIVDSKFTLDELEEVLSSAADYSVLRAAIVP